MSSGEPNLYELLGVTDAASAAEIRAAYRQLSRVAHPDAGGNPALFRLISDAHDTLRDPLSRASYDAALHATLPPSPVPTPTYGPAPSRPSDHATAPTTPMTGDRDAELVAAEIAARRLFGDDPAAWTALQGLIDANVGPTDALVVVRRALRADARRHVALVVTITALTGMWAASRASGAATALLGAPPVPFDSLVAVLAAGGLLAVVALAGGAAYAAHRHPALLVAAWRGLVALRPPWLRGGVGGATLGVALVAEHVASPRAVLVVVMASVAGSVVVSLSDALIAHHPRRPRCSDRS